MHREFSQYVKIKDIFNGAVTCIDDQVSAGAPDEEDVGPVPRHEVLFFDHPDILPEQLPAEKRMRHRSVLREKPSRLDRRPLQRRQRLGQISQRRKSHFCDRQSINRTKQKQQKIYRTLLFQDKRDQETGDKLAL